MAFLNGVEVLEQPGAQIAVTPETAVIALVGIAPTGPVEEMTLVTSDVAAAAFGKQVRGYSIPQALAAIFANGGAKVLVVNVFDADTMTETISAESRTIASRKIKVSNAGFVSVTTVTTTGGSPVTLTAGTDYTVDAYGEITILNATYANGTALLVTYKIVDAAEVDAALIVGTVTSGVRTGLQMFDAAFSEYGYNPNIVIAPYYSQLATVQAELVEKATLYSGVALLDTAESLLPSGVITGRGAGGDYEVSDPRAVILYPWLKYASPDSGTNLALPYSAAMAGVISATHAALGFQRSPSNRPIRGIAGVERQLVGRGLDDTGAEWNLLNAAGVVTIYQGFGTGTLTWGNHTSAYPANTAPEQSFIAVRTVADVLYTALKNAMRPFLGQPVTQAWIDSVRAASNGYINKLIGDGALIDGEVTYNDADNSPEELALGHVTFRLVFMPPVPAERITFIATVDTSLLNFA